MINNDVFLTTVAVISLSLFFIPVFIILLVKIFMEIFKTKCLRISLFEGIVLILALVIQILSIPFWCTALADNANNPSEMEKYYQYAIKTSILPSVKAFAYSNLGAHYMSVLDGQKAIDTFILSNEVLENKYNDTSLCLLYSYKGERDSAVNYCLKSNCFQFAALNYAMENNYRRAFEVMNKKISENPRCWDYVVIAYLYRKNGDIKAYNDYIKKVSGSCKASSSYRKVVANSRYYDDLFKQNRKKYKF